MDMRKQQNCLDSKHRKLKLSPMKIEWAEKTKRNERGDTKSYIALISEARSEDISCDPKI